jgi:hypothetical protein
MNLDDINTRLGAIADSGNDDPERAHVLEESLYLDVLRAIAHGAEDPQGLARLALIAQNLDFDRCYA